LGGTPGALPMAINLNALNAVQPSQEHGSLAAARVPFLNSATPAAVKRAASSVGMKVVGPDQYRHADGSWLLLDGNGTPQRGYRTSMFRGVPQNVAKFPMAARAAYPSTTATAKVASRVGSSLPKFVAGLKRKGFTQVLPTYFSHADGSWVAIDGKSVVRGLNQERVNDKSFYKQAGGGRGSKKYPRYTSKPSGSWSWYVQNTALGQLPLYPSAAVLRSHGFVQRGGMWRHPDGSYTDGSSRFGWQKWTLGQLPYNGRVSAP
jgi:hypothetical protein